MQSCTLHKWPEQPGCNLPSISPACIQAEAYLRFCGADFQVQTCTSTSKSPAGQLPAIERDADVAGAEPNEFCAAGAVIAYVSKHARDLDSLLTAAQRAELLAFSGLVHGRLDVATDACMWLEPRGFAEHKKAAYGATLPFPLSYIVPWTAQREVQRRHAGVDIDQVYTDACEALGALADRLRASSGHFFFGVRPCSLDALLVGHFAFYRTSPAAAPVLHDKVNSYPVLCAYVDHVMTTYFAAPAPRAGVAGHADEDRGDGPSGSTPWSEAAKGTKSRVPVPELTAAELAQRRRGWYWLAGAGAAIACYVLLSGRYPALNQVIEALGRDDDGDDGDDGDDEDDGDE